MNQGKQRETIQDTGRDEKTSRQIKRKKKNKKKKKISLIWNMNVINLQVITA